jgi:hypothetical protein
VIDEQDIYLHPDLQRQLVALLTELGPDILIATHSTEIVAECEPSSLLNVNKRNASAQRVRDVSQLKRVFSALGSNLNPTLTQLAKTRRVVFVEGLDFQLLATFARTLGLRRVANRSDFAVVRTEGFNPRRAADLAAGIEETVGSRTVRAVIFDRDFRSDAELADMETDLSRRGFLVRIHGRKELENYLLDANVITRSVNSKLAEKARRTGEALLPCPDVTALLDDATNALRHEVFAQLQARESDYARRLTPSLDPATLTVDISRRFEAAWASSAGRLALVPGKDILASVNRELQRSVGVSVSDKQIAQQFRVDEIHPDIASLLQDIAQFGARPVPD